MNNIVTAGTKYSVLRIDWAKWFLIPLLTYSLSDGKCIKLKIAHRISVKNEG